MRLWRLFDAPKPLPLRLRRRLGSICARFSMSSPRRLPPRLRPRPSPIGEFLISSLQSLLFFFFFFPILPFRSNLRLSCFFLGLGLRSWIEGFVVWALFRGSPSSIGYGGFVADLVRFARSTVRWMSVIYRRKRWTNGKIRSGVP